MKKAEDFRKAFGPATPGFETVVKKTIKELRAQEIKPVVKEWRRWRRPVFAMAMALVLFVGFVAVSGTLNPFNRQDRIRSEEESLYTAQPITTVLSMGAGQEEGDGDGAESGITDGGKYSAANIDESVQRSLLWFFESWAQDPENVKWYCTPEWRESTDREETLRAILADRTPLSYQINGVSGQEGDPTREAVCTVEMEKGRFERFTIALIKDEYESYDVDPEGLKSGDPVEANSFAKTVVLSEEGLISARLDLEYPGLSEKLVPVNLSSEKNGLRAEVISGYVSEKDGYFVISLEDPEGKYSDYGLSPWFENSITTTAGTGWHSLGENEAEHRHFYLYHPKYSNPVQDMNETFTVGVETITIEQQEGTDLLPLLQRYGKTVEGIQRPAQVLRRSSTQAAVPKDLKVLDYTQPLDIPLFKDVCLSGIGWIDGQLHVQFHNTGIEEYRKNGRSYDGVWSVWPYCNAEEVNYSSVQWDANYDGKEEWEEYIYDVGPEECDGLELTVSVSVLADVLDDGWMVEIPLEQICGDVLKSEHEMFPINLSCEDNGFRMEVISGKVSGKEASFKITLEDLEGKYADYTWSQSFEVEIPDVYSPSCSSYPLNGSETEHRITYQHTQEFTEPVRNGEQTVTVKAPNIRLEEEAEISLIPLLREHGKTEDGVRMPRLLSSYPDQSELPKDLKVLDYNKPLDIRLFKDVKLSGIGWIDDQLHVQFHNTGRCGVTAGETWYNAWNTWIDGQNWTEIGYSKLDWDENSDSFPEWTEYVINVKPEEAEDLELVACITVLKEILTGSWQVEVPLNQIWAEADEEEPAETAEAEEPVRLDRLEDYNQMQLWSFFQYWAQGDADYMIYELEPEQRDGGKETLAQLRELMEGGTPLSYQINSRRTEIGGSIYVCTVEMDPGNGEAPRYERFDIHMKGQAGENGIDLTSLKERQPGEKNPDLQTVSLAREAIINDYLDYFDPGVRERLQPIGLSCENNGIRMELISGLVDGTEEWVFYSVEDIEKKYDNYQLDGSRLEEDTGILNSFSSSPVYRDKAEHKDYFLWNPHYGSPVDTTARDISLKLNYLDGNLQNRLNVTELLEQYGENAEGIQAPENAWSINSDIPEGFKVLDYHNPLDIQLLPNAAITGISWIDDQLHVQICINGMLSHSIFFNETAEGNGEIGKSREVSYSPVEWFEDEKNYKEYVFDYKPGDEKETTLAVDLNSAQERVIGPWEFRFPLGMICPDVKDEKNPEAEDEAVPVERLEEDFGNISLEEREGKITFDVYANTDVYTKNGIGYALMEDGTAESVKTSTCMPSRDEIIIPERVRDYIVTAIGTRTFDGYDVKSLTLPDTVKTISKGAFSDCTNLVYFRIPDGVSSIEDEVFYDCVSMTDVIIPDSVTEIGSEAFYNCRSLTAAGIPERTVSIGSYAFLGCDGLTSITLPDTLEILGAYTFSRCNGLESVEIPGGVTSVEKGSFKDCTGLKAVRLKEGIAEIGEDAFSGCGALDTVELPASLLTIGDRAFRECGSMKQLVLPDGLTFIGRAAFMNCTGLEEIVIPESVTTIELHAFRGCINLTCVVKDGSYAKDYCEGNGIPYVVK